jgi:hypothetical protein
MSHQYINIHIKELDRIHLLVSLVDVAKNLVRSCQGIERSSTESASACFMMVAMLRNTVRAGMWLTRWLSKSLPPNQM